MNAPWPYCCDCGDTSCSFCSETPPSLTVDLPFGVDDNCSDCTAFEDSYSINQTDACVWYGEFAISGTYLGASCTNEATILKLQVLILSGGAVRVTAIIEDPDATPLPLSQTFRWQKTITTPIACCDWLIESITFSTQFGQSSCDMSGTTAEITASGCAA